MIFIVVSALAFSLVQSRCNLKCDAPYALNKDDCACNANLTVAPSSCASGFTANNTSCQCINAANATENYNYECKYGFVINSTTCEC